MSGHSSDPYAGLINYVLLPAIGTIGLALFALGNMLSRRRRAAGDEIGSSIWDLGRIENQQSALIVTGVVGAVVVFLMSAGGVRAIEYSESNEFCGEACHTVMSPEYVAYDASPHAQVACVDCHVGDGAGNFVKAKMQGMHQLIAMVTGDFDRPIATPIDFHSTESICESCHWPNRDIGDKPLSRNYYLTEGFDEPWVIEMSVKVGGGSRENGFQGGAHWHMNIDNDVEYAALDDRRQTIAWVRMTDREGTVTEYRNVDLDEEQLAIEPQPAIGVDCLTCHNRPAHKFRTPVETLNDAFRKGVLDANLPGIRPLALELLADDYDTTTDALTTIATDFPAGVADEDSDWAAANMPQLEHAVLTLQRMFTTNRNPEMRVKWDTHLDNKQHWSNDGCFRCHAGNMVADGGREISSSCDTCHVIKGQGRVGDGTWQYDPNGLDFIHPADEEVMNEPILCSECHDGALGYGF
jgi:hypothetical protein